MNPKQTNTTTDIPIEPVPAPTSVSASNVVQRPHPSPPPFPPTRPPRSPSSTDSNVDVTAYAGEKVQLLEEAQRLAQQQTEAQDKKGFAEEEQVDLGSVPKVRLPLRLRL